MKLPQLALLVVALFAASIAPCRAADHIDSPAATAEPTADIDDVYAWMLPDAQTVALAMTIGRDVPGDFRFSDAVQYIFHTTSAPAYGSDDTVELDVVCTFRADQRVRCTVGDLDSVSGDAGDDDGVTSDSGDVRVFAGQRNDPFFFNLAGFRKTAEIVAGAASGLDFDDAGCPLLDQPTAGALVTQLQTAPGGGPALNAFDGFNALALVLAVDKDLLTQGGPILGVSGSTRANP